MAATVAASESRIEIVGERRRAYDAGFRAQLVQASLAPGVRIRDLARRHGVCVSLIYRWRRSAPPVVVVTPATEVRPDTANQMASGRTGFAASALEFVPIGVFGRAADEGPALVAGRFPTVAPQPPSDRAPRPGSAMGERPGLIEIDLSDGTRLRVDAFVNERALRRVMAVLKAVP